MEINYGYYSIRVSENFGRAMSLVVVILAAVMQGVGGWGGG